MSKNFLFLFCFALALFLSSIAEAADPDLLVWYKFDETAGTIAYDSSDYGNDGVLMGDPQWTAAGQYGGCLDFDGSGDYVEDADGENYLNGQTAFTVCAWVKSRVINTDKGFLIGLVPVGGDRSVTMRYDSAGASFGGDDVLKMAVSSSDMPGADGQQLESSAGLQNTDWTHYLMTWSSGGLIRFYVNGVEDTPTGRNNANTGGTSSENTTFIVGRGGKDQSATSGWDGLIDDVRIYKRVLTQEEIEDVRDGKGGREASGPSPANHAVDVPVDANLTWNRGEGAVQEEVYFGTDPCALPKVADIVILPINPALYDPPGDLVASTTYYWEVVEVNGVDRFPSGIWEFTTIRGEAQCDYPYDGAVISGDLIEYPSGSNNWYIWTKLTFLPGATATKHTGYFNEDYSKVETRAEDANLGQPPYASVPGWEYTYFAGNPQVPPADETLVRGTKYYWTVDAEDAEGNVFGADIWEFAIQGFYAFEPSPPNESIFISTTPFLSWLPGFGVEDHDIYMGTSWEDVNNAVYDYETPPPEFVTTRLDPNYQVVTALPHNTKIYWRVDEVQGRLPPFFIPTALYKGPVWEFTTLPAGVGQVREDLWWNLTTSGSANRTSLSWLYDDPNFPGQPHETRMLNSFNSGTALGNDYGGMIHGWLHPAYSGNYTFWISTDDNGELFLSTDETPANMQLIAWIMAWSPSLNWYDPPETYQQSAPIYLEAGQKYYIRATWKEGGGGDHCQVAWQGPDQPLTPVTGSAAAVIPGNRLSPFVQLWAHDPDPRQMQHAVPTVYSLRWGPGDHAAQHDVYLGTDKASVTNATPSTPGIYKGRIGPNSLGPLAFDAAKFYYWRVDEVNLAGPDPCVWKGATWTFRTEGAAGGLRGDYYEHTGDASPAGFEVYKLTRIDPEVNFDWGTGPPDPNVSINDFTVRWSGHVEPLISGDWMFWTNTDDGVRLWIDDVLIIDDWEDQGPTDNNSPRIPLVAGTLYDIRMEYYENGGGAVARLSWDGPSTPRQIIPAISLWPPLFATTPRPPDGATVDDRTPALEWMPGLYADYHEVYFSTSFDDVNNRNPAIKQITTDPCRPYPAGPRLTLGETYYWLVDEVQASPADRWNARTVWSFTISECLSLDNMEDYNDRDDIRVVWRDGSADVVWGGIHPYLTLIQGGSSGSNLNVSTAVGAPVNGASGPIPPTPLNNQAMVLLYDNDGFTYIGLPGEEKWVYDAPYYSEIEANTVGDNSLDVGQTWDSEGVKSLSLSFQGHPESDGSYNASAWPKYTIYGRGRDIWGRYDEFYYLSQYPFTGSGSVQVQVLSVDNTDPWAKAGVMIREKRTPYSKHASVFITPGQGVTFQYRDSEDGPSTSITKPGITAPQYVKLERTISGAFEAKHSANGFVWEDVNAPGSAPVLPEISMGTISDPNIYVGTAVTSHNANETCAADFNNLLISPLPPNWVYGNIGTNDPEQLYIALSDGVNTDVVDHNDVNAATLTTWQEWNIPLTDFTTVNLDAIKKVYIGFGDRDVPVLGGSGAIYVDDIRACPPRCVPAFAQMIGDIAQPYDCTVDEKDLRVMAGDWLLSDDFTASVVPNSGALVAHWPLDTDYSDVSGNGYHGTPMGGASLITDGDRGGVLYLASDGDYVDCGNPTDPCALDFGTADWTVSAWVKTTMTGTGGDADKGVIYGKGGDQGGGHRYGLYVNENQNPAGHVNLIIDDNAGDGIGSSYNKIQFTGDTFVSDGEWHHVVGLRDVNELRLYIDGLPDGSTTIPADYDLVGVHQHNAYIGTITAHADDPNGTVVYKYLQGSVDDVRVYGYALSEGEVAYLATDGGAGIHFPIISDADLYQKEPQGQQWINFKDYSLLADQYLEKLLWPTP